MAHEKSETVRKGDRWYNIDMIGPNKGAVLGNKHGYATHLQLKKWDSATGSSTLVALPLGLSFLFSLFASVKKAVAAAKRRSQSFNTVKPHRKPRKK